MRSDDGGGGALAGGDAAVHVLVPAAGRGERFAGAVPKLFLEVKKRALLAWTVDALLSAGAASVTVALGRDRFESCRGWWGGDPRIRCAEGGETRQASVSRALAVCPAGIDDLVAVHDGARPALSREDFRRVCRAASDGMGAVLGRFVSDTVKRTRAGRIVETVDRRDLFRAETPQVFSRRILEEALRLAQESGIEGTDESSLVERVPGARILVVEAGDPNPKLTLPSDLPWIETLLEAGELGAREEEGI